MKHICPLCILRGPVGRILKIPNLGMKFGHWPKFQGLHIYYLKYPEFQISLRFALRLAISKIIFHFPIGHSVKLQSSF